MKKYILIPVLCCLAVLVYVGYRTSTREISPFKKYDNLIPGTYRVGFTNLDEEITISGLPVQGTVPPWISGTLMRNGPAKFSTENSWVSNWFDGLAMLHAFTIHNGTVSYANKFLRTSNFEHVQKTSNMHYRGFLQDPCPSLFNKFISLFVPHHTKNDEEEVPNANVNIARYSDHYVALTEAPLPVEFDPQTLETLGMLNYKDQLPHANIHDTAHPHYDPITHENLGYFTQFGRVSSVNLYSIANGSTQRTIIAQLNVQEPSYMHSFAITPRYAILTALPLVVNPLDLLKKEQSFIKSFKWKPEQGTNLIVVDRIQKKVVGSFKTEPFFAFHTVNAFEEGNRIHLDIVTYPDASGLAQASLDTILAPSYEKKSEQGAAEPDAEHTETGFLKRFTVNLTTGNVSSQRLSSMKLELPRINYAYNGKKYTYVYGFSRNKKNSHAYVADMLVKINVNNGATLIWQQPHCFPGEPVFIAHPQAHNEDDGVIASVVLDAQKGTSFLLILNAQDFTELARVYVPHHIPFGIHGQFFA